MSAEHCLDYFTEVLVLLSVLLIWWPAFKVSRALLVARDMASLAKRTSSSNIAQFATDVEAKARTVLTEFDQTGFRMLIIGFFCGALSSLIKLFYLIPASHH